MTDDSLETFQGRFARGLLDGDGIECEAGFGKGYAIHARNVRTSLLVALEQVFPVVRLVVGADFFAQAARAFVAVAPPRHGWLSAYGDGFPEFVTGYQPASSLPYLGDLARLEWARVAATFGDVAAGIDLGALAALPPAALLEYSPRTHPCATLIRSAYPVYSIWAAHIDPTTTGDSLSTVSCDRNPQDLLITKAPSGEAVVRRLQAGETAFLLKLASGIPLGAAWQAAIDADPQFDLAVTLGELAAENAFVD